MKPLVMEIKKYQGCVNAGDFPEIPDAAAGICSQLQSRFISLMAEETDCMMIGSVFPEEKKREMAAIAAFLNPGIDDEG